MPSLIGAVPWAAILSSILYWTVWTILGAVLMGVMWFFYRMTTFPYKMTYFPVVGTGREIEGVDMPRKNRLRLSKDKMSWEFLYPLFRNKTMPPIKNSYVYPGRQVFAFKVGDDFIPAKITIGDVDKPKPLFSIEPIPLEIRKWQYLALKQNEQEFTKASWWDENRTLMVAMFTVVCCCAVAALTVWWTYQYGANQAAEAGQNFAQQAISNFAAKGAPR